MRVYLIILIVLLIGCAPKKPKVVDPCSNAPKLCWGKAGQDVQSVLGCNQLTACFDWRVEAK
jgi:hypothetical protein